LPLVSLILGLLSIFAACIPIILGIAAIVTGVSGKKKARAFGQSTGMATAGIILGIIGIVISLIIGAVFLAGGLKVFNKVKDVAPVVVTLQEASTAAEAYGSQNTSYEGLTTEALSSFGYTPPADIEVKAGPSAGGTAFCIQGQSLSNSDTLIHIPASGNTKLTITSGDKTYTYSTGGCPVS